MSRTIIRTAILAAGLLGSLPAAGNEQPLTLWEARGQHVRLAARDGGEPNSHPARLEGAQIRQSLSLLRLQPKPDGEPVEVFTPDEAEFLSAQLAKAFHKASPDQDVLTATIGLRKTRFGLREPRRTTARVFVENGRLNLILGAALADVPDTDSTLRGVDPRLVEDVVGVRAAAASAPAWRLVPSDGAVAVKRHDWAVVTLSAVASPMVAPTPAGLAVQGLSPPPPPVPRSIEERLRLLEDLNAKGLVSPEEYALKRKQILDSL